MNCELNTEAVCDECYNNFLNIWVNEQCTLDELIEEYCKERSPEEKEDIKATLSKHTRQWTCKGCKDFFFAERRRKYCCPACKQEAYRVRKKVRNGET